MRNTRMMTKKRKIITESIVRVGVPKDIVNRDRMSGRSSYSLSTLGQY